ncbi:MAG: formate dehydrogenase accessory sulfurtransferase FdhD [Angustibacter sp.]
MAGLTRRAAVTRVAVDADGELVRGRRSDTLAVEEPLQIRVDGHPLTVTMRTPGDDLDLALGLLLTEGLIAAVDDVLRAVHCPDAATTGFADQVTERPGAPPDHGTIADRGNVVDVTLRPGVELDRAHAARSFDISSACGVCGKESIDDVRVRARFDVRADPVRPDAFTLLSLPDALRRRQRGFDRTGGLHAAGLATAAGELLVVREDIGRHNAVDKVIGWAGRQRGLPLTGCILVVSSRASFEITQKAVVAGIPCLAAVSAPSSLAVQLAQEVGMTLAAFVRPPRMTLYAGADQLPEPPLTGLQQRDVPWTGSDVVAGGTSAPPEGDQ